VSVLPALAVLIAVAVPWGVRRARGVGWLAGPVWRAVIAVAVPVGVAGIALGIYNLARFGSFTEFGQRYQLAGVNLLANYDKQFSFGNVLPNLYTYFLRPPVTTGLFPFVLPRSGLNGGFPSFLTPSLDYVRFESIAGVLLAVPFVWIVLVWMIGARRLLRPGAAAAGRNAVAEAASSPDRAGVRWLVVALAIAAALVPFPVLLQSGSGMRYLAELTFPMLVIVTIAFWDVLSPLDDRGRRAARIAVLATGVALGVVTVAIGVLFGVTGSDGDHFSLNNPRGLRSLMESTYTGSTPAVAQAVSRLGLEPLEGGDGWWMGEDGARLDIMTDHDGWVRLDLSASIGPCLAGRPGTRLIFGANPDEPLVSEGPMLGAVNVPRTPDSAGVPIGVNLRLHKGLNCIYLVLPEPPAIPGPPDRPKSCRQMMAISKLAVRDLPTPPAPRGGS
jgi:hypothetical protein